nr:hypothetical protein CFP56_63337 [Quercus suber]
MLEQATATSAPSSLMKGFGIVDFHVQSDLLRPHSTLPVMVRVRAIVMDRDTARPATRARHGLYQNYAGGYQDGTTVNFCETGYPSYGHPIGQINVWSTVQAVRGINFNYDDPNQALSIPAGTQTYGTTSGEGITGQTLNINYAGGELISSVTMYAPDGAMYVRGLTITTNMGQTLQAGVDASSGFNAFTQDVGTGILIGAAGGYQPGIIDDLGFLFLDSPVASVVVTDITVTGGPTGAQDIAPMTLAAQHFFDGDTTTESWSFSGSKEVTSTTVITQTIVDTFGGMEAIAVSFSGGFLDIIKTGDMSTTTFSWSTMQTSTTTTMVADAVTLSWMQGGTLQPNEGITCDSVSGQGSGTFPFTSTVTITLQASLPVTCETTNSTIPPIVSARHILI